MPVELDRKGRARRERPGLAVVVVVVLLLGLLAAAGYAAAYSTADDRVPRGSTISGVAVGGLTREAAIARLQSAFAARSRLPILLAAADATGADRTVTISPDQVGLSIDAAASVDETGARRSWSPQRLWDYFSDPVRRQAVVRVDASALADRIRTMSGGFGAPPADARVVFTPRGVKEIPGQTGDAVPLDTAVQALETAYLSDERRAEVPLLAARPAIDANDLATAVAGFARPAMSAPVTLAFGARRVTLRPAQYAAALAMVPSDGHLVPRLDESRVLALVAGVRAAVGPRDATVRLVHGRPRVIAGRPGTSYAGGAVVTAFRAALTSRGRARTRSVPGAAAQPAVTTADARRLGISRPIAAFTARVPAGDAAHVAAVAAKVEGRVLRPGDTLAMPRGSGPVAAAVLGAAFRAGLADVTPGQPVVIDPNSGDDVAVGLRFRADGPYGVLIDVVTTPARSGREGAVRVRLWSTKRWRVSVRRGRHTDLVQPPVRIGSTPRCRPVRGVAGYTVRVTRVFGKVGKPGVDHSETFRAVTSPVDRVVCR